MGEIRNVGPGKNMGISLCGVQENIISPYHEIPPHFISTFRTRTVQDIYRRGQRADQNPLVVNLSQLSVKRGLKMTVKMIVTQTVKLTVRTK